MILMTEDKIVTFVNSNCRQQNCFVCPMEEIFGSYTKCPYLDLKAVARRRMVTKKDLELRRKNER